MDCARANACSGLTPEAVRTISFMHHDAEGHVQKHGSDPQSKLIASQVQLCAIGNLEALTDMPMLLRRRCEPDVGSGHEE
jgi:hypothetical protein